MFTDVLLESRRRTSKGAAEGASAPPPHLGLISRDFNASLKIDRPGSQRLVMAPEMLICYQWQNR